MDGVRNLAECAKELGTGRVVFVSTDEVYGSIPEGSFKRERPRHPAQPPTARPGKASSSACPTSTPSTGHNHASGPTPTAPINTPKRCSPSSPPTPSTANPSRDKGGEHNVRDWLYVDDHASGIDCAPCATASPASNVAGGNERKTSNSPVRSSPSPIATNPLIQWVPDRPGHDRRYSIDASKLKALGWQPAMPWEDGMEKTVKGIRKQTWWRKIKSGEFKEYYARQYAALKA